MILVKSTNGAWTIDSRYTCHNQFSLANTAPSEKYEARAGIKWNEKSRIVTIDPFAITSTVSEKESDKLIWLEYNLPYLEAHIMKQFKITPSGRPSNRVIYLCFVLGKKRHEYFMTRFGYGYFSENTVYKVL